MSETVAFTDFNIDFTVLFYLIRIIIQMARLRFEPTTLGSDFSRIIFSVLAVTATWLLVQVIVEY
jgi:hypothetical protein